MKSGSLRQLSHRRTLEGYVVTMPWMDKKGPSLALCYCQGPMGRGWGWDWLSRATVFRTRWEALRALCQKEGSIEARRGVQVVPLARVARMAPYLDSLGRLIWRPAPKKDRLTDKMILRFSEQADRMELEARQYLRIARNMRLAVQKLESL